MTMNAYGLSDQLFPRGRPGGAGDADYSSLLPAMTMGTQGRAAAYPYSQISANPIAGNWGGLAAQISNANMIGQAPALDAQGLRSVAASQVGYEGPASMEASPLGAEMASQALSELSLGGRLSAEEEQQAEQASRGAWANRGLAMSNPAMFEEVLARDRFARQRQAERRGFADQVWGREQARGLANLQADVQARDAELRAAMANQQAGLQAQLANQQQGFNVAAANQQAAMQTALANQQAGVQVGLSGLDAGLRAAMSNQQADLTAAQANQGTQLQSSLAQGRDQLARDQQRMGVMQSRWDWLMNAGENRNIRDYNAGLREMLTSQRQTPSARPAESLSERAIRWYNQGTQANYDNPSQRRAFTGLSTSYGLGDLNPNQVTSRRNVDGSITASRRRALDAFTSRRVGF